MNPAPTVPSIADVDPDLVLEGDQNLLSADRVIEPHDEAQPGDVPTKPFDPSSSPVEAATESPAAVDGYVLDEVVPPDYVADYDDDQTSGVDDDMVDQRIPFT